MRVKVTLMADVTCCCVKDYDSPMSAVCGESYKMRKYLNNFIDFRRLHIVNQMLNNIQKVQLGRLKIADLWHYL